jgi:hypothetical protein
MTTDELINALSRAPEPVKPNLLSQRLALAIIGGIVLGLIFIKLTFGFRPDIGVAAPVVAMKAGLSALIATFAGGLAITLAKPVARGQGKAKRASAPLITLVCALLAIGAITLFSTEPGHRFVAFTGGGFPWCIVIIPLAGAPATALLMWALREAAPTRLALAGAAVGAMSGGLGAMVYAMFCPVDSVAFVTIWYVVGIGVASAIGAIIGLKLLRW